MDLHSPQGFPVNQLPDRYDLARSVVYTRLHQLDITPIERQLTCPVDDN